MTRRELRPTTLRRRLVLAFSGLVTVTVILLGGITYIATISSVRTESDRSLVTAAATVAAGGKVVVQIDSLVEDTSGHPTLASIVSVVQTVNPNGAVAHLSGADIRLPVSAEDLRLAQSDVTGVGRFESVTVDGADFRIYTLANGTDGAVQVGRNLASSKRLIGHMAWITSLIGLGVILTAVAAGWMLARQISRRLAALTNAAETVTETGDLAVPIDGYGRDEVGRLAVSLRTMLAELGASRESQRRLVQNAGHELRTPITSLRTNAVILQRFDDLPPDDRAEVLGDIHSELKELTNLVNDLVASADDRRTPDTAGRRAVRLDALVDEVAARARRRTGRSIRVAADDSVVVARASELASAVTNLVENAAKFDPDGTEPIDITVRNCAIQVQDRGPGVAREDLDRIFERFYRADSARSLPGSGLGLAIVHDVATKLGGHVTAAPRDGGGLVFTLTLPADEDS